MRNYLLPCVQDKYRAKPQVKIPTKSNKSGAFFLSFFSTPLAKVVFASLLGGDSGGTCINKPQDRVILYYVVTQSVTYFTHHRGSSNKSTFYALVSVPFLSCRYHLIPR